MFQLGILTSFSNEERGISLKLSYLNPGPAEPGHALPLQCRSRSAELDLHCLSLKASYS